MPAKPKFKVGQVVRISFYGGTSAYGVVSGQCADIVSVWVNTTLHKVIARLLHPLTKRERGD